MTEKKTEPGLHPAQAPDEEIPEASNANYQTRVHGGPGQIPGGNPAQSYGIPNNTSGGNPASVGPNPGQSHPDVQDELAAEALDILTAHQRDRDRQNAVVTGAVRPEESEDVKSVDDDADDEHDEHVGAVHQHDAVNKHEHEHVGAVHQHADAVNKHADAVHEHADAVHEHADQVDDKKSAAKKKK